MTRALIALAVYGLGVFLAITLLGARSLPDDGPGLPPEAGPVHVALDELGGKEVPTDYLVDYASARALRDRRDPYAISAGLIEVVGGPPWPIEIANPHPPTLLAIALPFSLLPYRTSLAAWSMAMVFAYVFTLYFAGLRFNLAVPFGIGVALTFPGAYGIGNPVPIIGLGIALAYRFRNTP